jgi:hypothetical protein
MENTILWDAVPTQRKKKEEKYNTPVVTMHRVEKVGGARKIEFNKAAQAALGIVGKDKVSFGYNAEEKRVFLRKSTLDTALELTQTCTFSDKRTYEYIAKNFGVNIEEGAEFDLLVANIGVEGAFELKLMGSIITNIPTLDISEISKTELGEISDEENLEADLSSIPEVPQGGVQYQGVQYQEKVKGFDSGIDTIIEHDVNDVLDHVEIEMPFDDESIAEAVEENEVSMENVEVVETAPARVKFAIDNTEEEAQVPAAEEEADEEDGW